MRLKILFTALLLSVLGLTSVFAQKDLSPHSLIIGKWKLLSIEKKDKPKSIKSIFGTKEVYQIFREDLAFKSVMGDLSFTGSWSIDINNKYLINVIRRQRKETQTILTLVKITETELVVYDSENKLLLTYTKQ